MLEQDLHASLPGRGLEGTHQALSRRQNPAQHRIRRPTCLHHCPVQHRAVRFPRHRVADRYPTGLGRLINENDPLSDEPFEGPGAVVGEGANDFTVIVPVVGKTIRLNNRPVGQVAEQKVGRIVDAISLLDACSTTQADVATAGDGVAPNMVLGLDDDDGGSAFPCNNRSRKPGCARTNDDDIRLLLPPGWQMRSMCGRHISGCQLASGQYRSHAAGVNQQLSPLHAHWNLPSIPRVVMSSRCDMIIVLLLLNGGCKNHVIPIQQIQLGHL